MTRIDDLSDVRAAIVEVFRRLESLERGNPLENSSITEGPGMRIAVPAGVHVDPAGSITAGAAALSGAHGGHVRGGKTSIGSDGVIRNDDGKIQFEDMVDPLNGVLMSWGGARHSIETVMGWQKTDIETVDGRAAGAKSAADAAQATANGAASAASAAQSSANTAKSRADAAYSLADGKVSADSPSIQSPTLVGPKITGITSGQQGNGWAVLLVNTSTGTLRFIPQG